MVEQSCSSSYGSYFVDGDGRRLCTLLSLWVRAFHPYSVRSVLTIVPHSESEPSSPAPKGNPGPVTVARSPQDILYIGPAAGRSEFTSERRVVASFHPAPSTTPSMWGTGSSDRAFDGSHATGRHAVRAVAEQAVGLERPVAAADTHGERGTGSARCAPLEDSSSGSTLPPPYE